MFRELVTQSKYDAVRAPIRRRCIFMVRDILTELERKFPGRHTYDEELRSDARVRDAVVTLFAMSYKPYLIAKFIAKPKFTELTAVLVLSAHTTIEIAKLLEAARNE